MNEHADYFRRAAALIRLHREDNTETELLAALMPENSHQTALKPTHDNKPLEGGCPHCLDWAGITANLIVIASKSLDYHEKDSIINFNANEWLNQWAESIDLDETN